MKKSIYLIAAAAMTLAGCSQDDLMDNGTTGTDGDAIAFESYLGKSAQTRATEVTTESLKGEGFTVDAYYTGTADFSAENPGEVFMKATKVTYNKDAWTYSPVKYWPNNAGDKVSFFAYGPYGNTNIKLNETSVSSIDFTVQNDVLDQVDFIYNNQETNSTLNKQKQTVDGKVQFQFQHALSRIAFTVAAAVDETSLGSVKLDGNSRINVKKVALVSSDVAEYSADAAGPFYESGTLDMLTGTWGNFSDETLAFTFAGKKHFYRTVQDKDVAVNPETDIDVVQLHKFNQKQRLLNDDSYLMIIPTDKSTDGNANTSFKIYIEYDVITEDDDLADVSKITNCILSKDALEVDFKAGKAYNFNLILGMTSVKFDVDEVTPWDETTDTDEWLPENETAALQGDGTETNPFLIYNAAQLASARDKINADKTYTAPESKAASRAGGVKYAEAYYKQMADIDLSGCGEWTPIGNSSVYFKGKYDGQGNAIKGLTLKGVSSDEYAGLFGEVQTATISNVNIADCSVSGKYIGVVVGHLVSGTVQGCIVSGNLDGVSNFGGVVCRNANGIIYNCTNNINVTNGGNYIGGIVCLNGQRVIRCVNNGSLAGNDNIGGISATRANSGARIAACYNTAKISGNSKIGGIIGSADGNILEIIASYNSGTVSGSENTGGIAGRISSSTNATITYCYYKENGSQVGIGSATSDTDGQTVPVSGNNWKIARIPMNNAISNYYNDASENKNMYNMKYVTGTGTTPFTFEDGTEYVEREIDGKGTKEDPYKIDNTARLLLVGNRATNKGDEVPAYGLVEWKSAYYIQTDDIELDNNKTSFNNTFGIIRNFYGTYDGNSYNITNYNPQWGKRGLICNNYGTVKNVHFVNGKSNGAIGSAVVNTNKEGGKVICCSYSGNFTTSTTYIAPIVFRNSGEVIGCFFNGTYKDGDECGGVGAVIGNQYDKGKCIGCYSTGNMNGGKKSLVARYYNGILAAGYGYNKNSTIGCYTTIAFDSNYIAGAYPIIGEGSCLASYYTSTYDKGFKSDGSTYIDGTETTWEIAVTKMNEAIQEAGYNYEYVANHDDDTKVGLPYVLVEKSSIE